MELRFDVPKWLVDALWFIPAVRRAAVRARLA